ncbi:MAG: hypothetical protein ACI8X5_003617 [Planctomycetota bacterium]|jgi:hypothetical protein
MTSTPKDASPTNWSDGEDSYRGDDRREEGTPRFSRFTLKGGRRRSIRRDEEREGSFVDVYKPSILILLLWVGLMNAADSAFTIYHLQVGGIELNPIAAMLLETGRLGFVFGKAGMITLALLVLCLHKNFYLARWGLFASVATYTTLVCYHIWLL